MEYETPFRSTVAIVGAGTQGRRLAYMVRIERPISGLQRIRPNFSHAYKWSTRGNDVHLLDAQASQLQGCHEVIEALQSAAPFKSPKSGMVITHPIDGLETVLQSAWLVIEVRKFHIWRCMTMLIQIVCPRTTVGEENGISRA